MGNNIKLPLLNTPSIVKRNSLNRDIEVVLNHSSKFVIRLHISVFTKGENSLRINPTLLRSQLSM